MNLPSGSRNWLPVVTAPNGSRTRPCMQFKKISTHMIILQSSWYPNDTSQPRAIQKGYNLWRMGPESQTFKYIYMPILMNNLLQRSRLLHCLHPLLCESLPMVALSNHIMTKHCISENLCTTQINWSWSWTRAAFTLELKLRTWTCSFRKFNTRSWQAFIQSSNYWQLDQSSSSQYCEQILGGHAWSEISKG